MKIIALDVGSKTIGTATTNSNIPTVGITVRFEQWDIEAGIIALKPVIDDFLPEKVVVGYPINMNGTHSDTTEMVDYFIEGFKIYYPEIDPNNIIKIDERRTSKMANSIMIEAGMRREDRKAKKDSLAAVLILEQYLNMINNI